MRKWASHMCFFAVLSALISESTSSHWGYPDLEAGAKEFPEWGGFCETGRRQSPINLRLQDSLKAKYEDLKFINYGKPQTGVTIINNGHTVQLGNFTYKMRLSQGPLEKEYLVEQIHMHWWSEHTIENVRYPLEAHIVHRNTLYSDLVTAAAHKDGIVVLGVLYHMSNEPNEAIQGIVDALPFISNYTEVNYSVVMPSPFQVDKLFPKITGYFTYAGSLTTPGCNEAVTWIVLKNSFPITIEQVSKFKGLEYAENKFLDNNYRFIQSTNNRPVMSVRYEELSSAKVHTPLLLLLLCALALHFF